MDGGGDRALYSSNVAVIREIYDSEYAHEAFAMDLERALDAKCSVIVIEPTQLGDETARWIGVGNCLHKTAVLSGISSILTGLLWHERPYISAPLGVVSVLCTGLYTVSWQFDPCVKYQVENDPRQLVRLPILTIMASATPVVLVRKDDSRRKLLHCSITILAAALSAFRIYQCMK